jgi:hypothetical protein
MFAKPYSSSKYAEDPDGLIGQILRDSSNEYGVRVFTLVLFSLMLLLFMLTAGLLEAKGRSSTTTTMSAPAAIAPSMIRLLSLPVS